MPLSASGKGRDAAAAREAEKLVGASNVAKENQWLDFFWLPIGVTGTKQCQGRYLPKLFQYTDFVV